VNKKYLTWKDIEALVDVIVNNIEDSGKKYDAVYGLPRGGLIPAVMLSHRLDIPLVDHNSVVNTKNVLWVDDINDTGTTLLKAEEYILNDDAIAVLYSKPSSLVKPNYVGEIITDDSWLVFPWETEQSSKADYLTIED